LCRPRETSMTDPQAITLRPARRTDLPAIVRLLADDHLGRGRERLEEPLPASYEAAFDAIAKDPPNLLIVAEGAEGGVLGDLQLTIIAGLSIRAPTGPCSRISGSTPTTAAGASAGACLTGRS